MRMETSVGSLSHANMRGFMPSDTAEKLQLLGQPLAIYGNDSLNPLYSERSKAGPALTYALF